jgi:predicted RNA-binding Zn ribbon-like protein
VIADPGGRERAPQPLRLVQAFVNTLDIENGVELLSSPPALHGVLVELGLLAAADAPLREPDLRLAVEVREGLRALALANNGVPAAPEELRPLERVARAARLGVTFEDGRARLVPEADGLDGALGRLVAVVQESMAAGTWWRLKGCPRDVCHWLFYDRSRNGSGRWCAMSVCGNRTNTKAYRRRATRSS